MQDQDVERILRDVLSTSGLFAAIQGVERKPGGWRVTIRDEGARILSTEVPDGRPGLMRAALTQWVGSR